MNKKEIIILIEDIIIKSRFNKEEAKNATSLKSILFILKAIEEQASLELMMQDIIGIADYFDSYNDHEDIT
jgi:hypothetical protein